MHPTRRRTLAPREDVQIQGFPDWYDFNPNPDKAGSKAQLRQVDR
jgi:site-specific DNA-cytosine methylase